MRFLLFLPVLLLTSCAAEKVPSDAVNLVLDKDAFQKDTNVDVNVRILNKDLPK